MKKINKNPYKVFLIASGLLSSNLVLAQMATTGTVVQTTPATTGAATTVTTTSPPALGAPATTVTTTTPTAPVPETTVTTTAPAVTVPAAVTTTAPVVPVPETTVTTTAPAAVVPATTVTTTAPTFETPADIVTDTAPVTTADITPAFLPEMRTTTVSTPVEEGIDVCPPASYYQLPPGYRLAGISPGCLAVPILMWEDYPY